MDMWGGGYDLPLYDIDNDDDDSDDDSHIDNSKFMIATTHFLK